MKDCEPPELAAADACHLTPHPPDFIVLTSPLKAPPVASWRFQPAESVPTDYLLYDCNKIH